MRAKKTDFDTQLAWGIGSVLPRRSRRAADSELQYGFLARMGGENGEGCSQPAPKRRFWDLIPIFIPKDGMYCQGEEMAIRYPFFRHTREWPMGPVMPNA
jgi:hypothetical protein